MKLVDRGGWLVAENAVVVGQVTLSRGVSVWYGAVLRGDMSSITVRDYTNLQDGCVLHCDPGKDLVVGRFVTVGHLAMVHARSVGDYALIGIHATLLSGSVIGEGSLIAAGALIREDQVIPPRSIVVGVPGKIIGQTDEAFQRDSEARAHRYFETAVRHAEGKEHPRHMAPLSAEGP